MDYTVFMFLVFLAYSGESMISTVSITTGSTTAAVNTTGTTVGTTLGSTAAASITGTTGSVTATQGPIIPRFQVKTSAGDVCILLVFNATIQVSYLTKDFETRFNTLPMTDAVDYEGSCEGDGPRNFTLWYPSKDQYCASWTLSFPQATDTTYLNNNTVIFHYIQPCFEPDAGFYNMTRPAITSNPTYEGTIGKTYQCDSLRVPSVTRSKFIMDSVMLQPFADKSSDKGHFGEVETCPEVTKPPPTTTKNPFPTLPSPFSLNWIIGIAVGGLVVILSGVTLVVYIMTKRRRSRVPYGNLQNAGTPSTLLS